MDDLEVVRHGKLLCYFMPTCMYGVSLAAVQELHQVHIAPF